MSADVVDIGAPLTKHDSAVDVEPPSPVREKARRVSHSAPGVRNIKELEEEGTEIEIAIETQKTGWKINTSPSKIEDTAILPILLTTPPVKRIDLHFPLGLTVTARNLKGVTIKDALDAIHKQFRKKVGPPPTRRPLDACHGRWAH
jgi:DNA-binding Lrp family transcriptional regulator